MSVQLGKIREFLTRDTVADNAGSAVAVGTTSTPVVPATPGRVEIHISNDSDAVVYLRLAASGAVVGQGIRLAVGGNFKTEYYNGAISAIHAGVGAKSLCVAEV